MNYLHIAGHLGKNPEVRYTSSGQKVTTLRVGCKSRKGQTIWWQATVWGDQFDRMIQYLKVGYPLIVMGEMLPPDIFVGRDGKQQISTQLNVHQLYFSPFGKPKDGDIVDPEEKVDQNIEQSPEDNKGVGSVGLAKEKKEFSDSDIPF